MNPARASVFIALALLAAAPAARAAGYAWVPTFNVDIPNGWTSGKTATGAAEVKNADSTGVITMDIISDAAAAVKMPYDDYARQVFAAAGIKKIEKEEAAVFAGLKGMAYYGRLTKTDGSVAHLKIIIVHIDSTRLIVITRSTATGISKAALAEVDKVISTTKLAPAKPNAN